MLGDGGRLDQVGVRLGLVPSGRRRGMGAPVVEDPGDVGDAVGTVHEPQDEVVVLAAVVARPEATELDGELAPVDAQVARVHERGHVVRRPARLDVAYERPVVGDDVLVAVEHVEGGVRGDAVGHVLQGVRGEGVVVVQEGDVVAAGEGHGGVGGLRDAPGDDVAGEVDARVGVRVVLQRGGDVGVGGPVVDQAELPFGVGLVAHRGDGLLEHRERRVVDGGEDGDERCSGPGGGVSGCRGFGGCTGLGDAGRRDGRRGVWVDEHRIDPDRPRDPFLAAGRGTGRVDGECELGRAGRDGALD